MCGGGRGAMGGGEGDAIGSAEEGEMCGATRGAMRGVVIRTEEGAMGGAMRDDGGGLAVGEEIAYLERGGGRAGAFSDAAGLRNFFGRVNGRRDNVDALLDYAYLLLLVWTKLT